MARTGSRAEAGTAARPATPNPKPPVADAPVSPPSRAEHPDEPVKILATTLRHLRHTLANTGFGLPLYLSEQAERYRAALLDQLDDYLLPRLSRLTEPILVVVGGSTGAGKSTLVNSLLRAPVSPAGVLRPTTRSPILVCDPADAERFTQAELLPEMFRVEATANGAPLRMLTTRDLPPGIALLDAPDIDSVVDHNRHLAGQLLAAADLWLFLTTAARYADAVPWDVLRDARERATEVAVVIDRVPDGARAVVEPHLRQMLADHGFADAPLFVIAEQRLDDQGLLPGPAVAPVREWLSGLATDGKLRISVARETLSGAIASLHPRVEALAAHADAQWEAAVALRSTAQHTYAEALTQLDGALWGGGVMRGEVLARWHALRDSGQLTRAVEARTGRLFGQVRTGTKREPYPGRRFTSALLAAVSALVATAASDAAEETAAQWATHPAGQALLDQAGERRMTYHLPPADLELRAERLVNYWHRGVAELVRAELGINRTASRLTEYIASATGLLVMINLFASTTPRSPRPRGSRNSEMLRKLIEAISADPVVAQLAGQARRALLDRVRMLLEDERQHFTDLLHRAGVDPVVSQQLREAAGEVEQARLFAGLTPTGRALPKFPELPEDPEPNDPETASVPVGDPAPEPDGSAMRKAKDETVRKSAKPTRRKR